MALTQQENALSPADLQFLCDLVRERAAIVLESNKAYLVKARLEPLARIRGFDSIAAMVYALRTPGGAGQLPNEVVDAMTTNETSFFRDLHPFETLRKHILPTLIAKRETERKLSIWCAASSSGQEPYSVAMLLREHFSQLASWTVPFIASDISETMLTRCREGVYSQLEINRGLPATYLVKYFDKRGAAWQIKEDIRRTIDFRAINLIQPWPSLPPLDIVFIRNVLIYFDLDTKRRILGRIFNLMRPGAYLFLGAAETTLNVDDRFRRVTFDTSTVYTKDTIEG